MENTKNKLPENIEIFFKELSEYLDTKLLFFGSIQRDDYFHGKSDIDVDIFTENENTTIMKLQHFLHVEKKEFKKFVWRLNHNDNVAHGYKLFYNHIDDKHNENNFKVEISIYNEKYRKGVLEEHNKKTVLPFYATFLLILLKFMYYNMHFISKDIFRYLKKKCLSLAIGLPEDEFIVLDVK
jgi:predicted nucleotidyltransferase